MVHPLRLLLLGHAVNTSNWGLLCLHGPVPTELSHRP